MARIRSVHPGLASDEAYMSMSITAKAAWPLLWTECDDQGVFEWKPIVLKARIFPADNIDFSALLDEWVRLDCIKMIEIDGKPYGLVRNFMKYQRPKNPSIRYHIPEMHMEYLGRKVVQSDNPPPSLPHEWVSPTENPPQMEEEGGRRKKESLTAAPLAEDHFEEFWKAFPKRRGENPKKPARKAFNAAIKSGCDPGDLILAIQRFSAENTDKIGTQYVPQAVTWLRQERWEQWLPSPEDTKKSAALEKFMSDRGYTWNGERWIENLSKEVENGRANRERMDCLSSEAGQG